MIKLKSCQFSFVPNWQLSNSVGTKLYQTGNFALSVVPNWQVYPKTLFPIRCTKLETYPFTKVYGTEKIHDHEDRYNDFTPTHDKPSHCTELAT